MTTTRINIYKLLLIVILVCPVFVDLINGYINNYLNLNFSLAIIFRGIIFSASLPFLFMIRDKLYQSFILSVCVLWVICNLYWLIFIHDNVYYSFYWEVQQFVRILFPFILLSVLFYLLERGLLDIRFVVNCIVIAGFITALFIFISPLTGMGLKTYGDNSYAGYGMKSFFDSQNDVSLVMLLSFPFSLFMLIYTKRSSYLIISILILFSSLIISTRSGLLGSLGVMLMFFFSFIFYGKQNVPAGIRLKIIVLLIFFFVFPALIYYLIDFLLDERNAFLLKKLFMLFEESPRGYVADAARDRILSRPFVMSLSGEGYSSLMKYMESHTFSFVETSFGRYVEQDIFEIIGAYGYILGALILAFPSFLFIKAFFHVLSTRKFIDLVLLSGISLFIIQSFTAGHALNSPTVSTSIIPVYLFIYKRKLFLETFTNPNILS